ncbi:peptidylprolyl isomerase [Nonlabens sp. Hel1_33_55]|uniref:peptidylprolyl isomerase n=1 Tax=Nonlabens sp. Hel1_33_55 TaxID=1336802 RepID=UPI000875E14C|nr:peptidylprolyl isomerase [Nonlabens sp. Hel1_33_55]SCY12490.1 peptidylprolyl isomerase [Nonlabens sp. Hel1_33_55]
MNSKLCLLLLLCFIASCKDTKDHSKEIQPDPEPVLSKEEKEELSLAEFYQPSITADGDTLLSYIPQDSVIPFFTRYGKRNPETHVRLKTKFGTIEMELFEETPIYRASFVYLIKNGYYDGTVAHRVVPRFIVQAGDSDDTFTATKRSSAGNYKLPPNILSNVKHAYGTLSSAKEWEDNPEMWHNPFDFFISLRATDHLDGEHTIFGRVTSGMEVAEKISQIETDAGDWPIVDVYLDMSVY